MNRRPPQWGKSLLGEDIWNTCDTSKWKFVTLEMKQEAPKTPDATSADAKARKRYWFTIQDPKVLEYDTQGLWIHPTLKGSYSTQQIQIGDEVAIYEPEWDRERNRQEGDGAKAVVALARVAQLEEPWVEEDDGFLRVSLAPLIATDKKGVSAAVVARIL